MRVKSSSKNKSQQRYLHYKSFGWLAKVAYRLRGDREVRKYLKSGKYKRVYADTAYKICDRVDLYVVDQFITSTVKRSRIKMKPDGCCSVHPSEYGKYGIYENTK